jgi:hypothetical protein
MLAVRPVRAERKFSDGGEAAFAVSPSGKFQPCNGNAVAEKATAAQWEAAAEQLVRLGLVRRAN